MKSSILGLALILAFFAIKVESCLVVVTCNVAQATYAAPCSQCGVCKEKCCRKYTSFFRNINALKDFLITYIFSNNIYIENVFLGREETLEDRTLQIECAPVTTAAPATTAAGRIDERQSNGKNQKYKFIHFEFSISRF